MMSLHRLSAGAGYCYLLRHTACGDVQRASTTPLTAYYTENGYPPGRWLGSGLTNLQIANRSAVTEPQMANLFGAGRHPTDGTALGRVYPTFASLADRIARREAALPPDLDEPTRADFLTQIRTTEGRRPHPVAVAGFDLTFTIPKSASVLWALADPATQAAIAQAHNDAVAEALAFLEQRALFTRLGAGGCAQVPTQGLVAAAFDHWDTRTGDPNLHTHVVVANKVQGHDGKWRSVDSRALHHAAVAVSELYDNLLADNVAKALPVAWGWRPRGERRTPAYELDGLDDSVLALFSSRSDQVAGAMTELLRSFLAEHGRGPSRVEVLQLRQRATRATRPPKTPHPLPELMSKWRTQAQDLTSHSPITLAAGALNGGAPVIRVEDLRPGDVEELAHMTLEELMVRRSTWTPWNALTEASRTTRALRTASPQQRIELIDAVTAAVLAKSLPLDPAEPMSFPARYLREDGTSVFTREGEQRFSHPRILDAEQRLLKANSTAEAPGVRTDLAKTVVDAPQRSDSGQVVTLAPDQVEAVLEITSSRRRLDVLVGPAGTGKTTTLRVLRTAWEAEHGRGSVIGLAPSSTAAHELATALTVPCENTAKWLHETTGPGNHTRTQQLRDVHRQLDNGGGDWQTRDQLRGRLGRLTREQARWALRPGQLLIVDEASLAGTLALDTLRAQTEQAGAKLLLVGDHKQLTAVDAGGAFGLLAEQGTASELRSLWRFRHRWEADATRRLRQGDPDVLQTYDEHDRIRSGTAETVLEDAFTGWQESQRHGLTAILVAADSTTVDALNHRAHADRIADGTVAPDGLTLQRDCHNTEVCVGDRILTRRNNRRLALPRGGHVRNGALWTVTAVHPDGSLDVTGTTPAETAPSNSSAVTLPADYVQLHVELGYATTAHRAQGLTVDVSHVVVGNVMSREALYVAMTRGRQANLAYVATDAIDPSCDELPDNSAVQTGRQVLEQVLARSSRELSATQTLTQRAEEAISPRRLTPISSTLTSDANLMRWEPALAQTALRPDQLRRVLDSPALGALLAALSRGAKAGHDIASELVSVVSERRLDDAQDLAAVLHTRIEERLRSSTPHHNRQTPALVSAEHAEITDVRDELDKLITARTRALSARLAEDSMQQAANWDRHAWATLIRDDTKGLTR